MSSEIRCGAGNCVSTTRTRVIRTRFKELLCPFEYSNCDRYTPRKGLLFGLVVPHSVVLTAHTHTHRWNNRLRFVRGTAGGPSAQCPSAAQPVRERTISCKVGATRTPGLVCVCVCHTIFPHLCPLILFVCPDGLRDARHFNSTN